MRGNLETQRDLRKRLVQHKSRAMLESCSRFSGNISSGLQEIVSELHIPKPDLWDLSNSSRVDSLLDLGRHVPVMHEYPPTWQRCADMLPIRVGGA